MLKIISKILLVLLLISVVASFFIFDLGRYGSFEYIKEQQSVFREYYSRNTATVLSAFVVSYVFVTAFSIPLATGMTLLVGAMFGFSVGLLVASFSSSVGATLAFLMSRFVMRDWIQSKYGAYLKNINKGFEKEGVFYLFALRLAPIFPFFVVNLVMGLLPIRAWAFYAVSQIGMLPGTAIFVYAGTRLATIESVGDIVSPSFLIAFTILGLFPIGAKKLTSVLRKKFK